MNILESIVEERRLAVEEARVAVPIEALREQARARTHHSLVDALKRGRRNIIAEVKKASPSAGMLRENYQPDKIAGQYAQAGAAAISVLTEPRHFFGSEQDLRAVRSAVDLPVLRKDFICDAYQVCEAAAWGADVVLLIVAVLNRDTLTELYEEATALGLDVLAEAHTLEEVGRALELKDAIVGVNSRNLKTLKTDLAVARKLAADIPGDRLSMAESGIRTRTDIEELEAVGYKGFLVGEALLKETAPSEKLRELLS
jgi:indole-3-glycerol phosphate synthase